MMNRIIRMLTALALGLIPTLLPATSSGNPPGEHVPVLYAHDNQALYRMEPNNGEFTKIGDISYDWGNAPYGFGQMVYDWKTHKLYTTERNLDLGNVVVEIDPDTAVALPIRIQSEEQALILFFVSYDPILQTLFIGSSSTPIWEFLQSLDLASGQLGPGTKLSVQDTYCIGAFFDKHGHPWLFSGNRSPDW